MQIQYNPDEIVALGAAKKTLRTALKDSPDQVGPGAALWRDYGLDPSFFDADHIIQLRTTMALEEYASAFRALSLAGDDATVLHRSALNMANIQIERFGLTNNPKRLAITEAISSAVNNGVFTGEIGNDTEVFYAVGGGIWKGTRGDSSQRT